MKNLFKLLFIIFSLAIFLFLEPPVLQAQQIDTTGFIQGFDKEPVVLISNNFLNSEISSYEENNEVELTTNNREGFENLNRVIKGETNSISFKYTYII